MRLLGATRVGLKVNSSREGDLWPCRSCRARPMIWKRASSVGRRHRWSSSKDERGWRCSQQSVRPPPAERERRAHRSRHRRTSRDLPRELCSRRARRHLLPTADGTKLHALSHAKPIALEIDGLDEKLHVGWSVLVVGTGEHLGLPHEVADVRDLPLEPWASGDKPAIVRLRPTKVSGRRIHRPASHRTAEGPQ